MLSPRPSQFSENPWSRRDSWDRQAFQYFSGNSTFYRLGHVGTAQTEIAWALLLRRRGEIDSAQARLTSALAQLRESGCDGALAEAQRRWETDAP